MAHLLIVDDEQSIQASLKEILEYEGHKVALAGTGMDGVLAATRPPSMPFFATSNCPKWTDWTCLTCLPKRASLPPW